MCVTKSDWYHGAGVALACQFRFLVWFTAEKLESQGVWPGYCTSLYSSNLFTSCIDVLKNAKVTEVASEAIVNIRTVKAFAMEEHEKNLFRQECHNARKYYVKLGYGIAIFQGLSNLVLNGN